MTGRAGKTGFESLWVRQSRPYAGDTYGLHLPLLAGTEVAIGFEDGNPDRPYIAGVLHDSAHGDHVTIRNDKRNVLRTPGQQQNPPRRRARERAYQALDGVRRQEPAEPGAPGGQ
ncbi:phage baseplate assembly protein V [Klebsiella pneumoniae subsp. pneumoniae]|nr:phage baseplate assembly protein V [Klebsiella pneumoniae subsp. pneumoniae]